MPVEVECRFEASGHVRVRRVNIIGRWQMVTQGRQWLDTEGRHVLVMLPELGEGVRELLLRADALVWELREPGHSRRLV